MILLASLLLAVGVGQEASPPGLDNDIANGRLCGHDARNNEALLAELRRRPSVHALQDDTEYVQLIDLETSQVWTFSVRGGRAYPAVSCSVMGHNSERFVFHQAVVCNGISQTDCQAFFLMNRMRNNRILSDMGLPAEPLPPGLDSH